MNAIILLSLFIGLGGVVVFFALSLTSTILNSTRNNLEEQSNILYAAIENFMMPGEAPLAVQYLDEARLRSRLSTIYLFRTDGTQAFTDNRTIAEVNEMVSDMFSLPDRKGIVPETREDGMFAAATGIPPKTGVFQTSAEGGIDFFHIYKPLINKPKCTGCHGADHTIREVLEIKTDITSSVRRTEQSLLISGGIFLGVLLLLSGLLTRFMKSTVLSPVRQIGEVCREVTGGNFSPRVEIKNRDEIGELGSTVNAMVEGLHERFELSKFVSNSTLRNLRESGEGQNLSLTLLFSDVRGFTSYSEKHTPEEVVARLNDLLNMQSQVISSCGGDIDKFVGDEVVAIFSGEDGANCACRAATMIQEGLESDRNSFDGLQVGIGVHTGEVIMGIVGSKDRADYTVIGDNVNLASRLCSAAGRGEILISMPTRKSLGTAAGIEGPYKLKVKGKENFVGVYKLRNFAGGTESERGGGPEA